MRVLSGSGSSKLLSSVTFRNEGIMKHLKKKIVAALCLCTVAALVAWFIRSPAVLTEEAQALAVLEELLNKPENLVAMNASGFSRGPRDRKIEWGTKDDNKLTGEEVADGRELAAAVVYGDLQRIQKVIDRYQGKPYSLLQVTWYVSHAFYEAGVPFRLRSHPDGEAIFLTRENPPQTYGNLSLTFVIGKAPRVKVSARPEGVNEGVWHDVDTDQVSPAVLMSSFGKECTRATLFRKSIKLEEGR